MKIDDSQLAALLASIIDGKGVAAISPRNPNASEFNVQVELEVIDNHRGDSPDILLWLNLAIEHPQIPKLNLRIPVPVEGEKAGIAAAMDDLRKFAERGHFPLQLPMLVIGGDGNPARRTTSAHLPTKVEVTQVPYWSFTS